MEPSQSQSSVSVYINPKFKTAHINPNFLLQKNSTTPAISKGNNIYINPKFKNAHINPNFLQKNHSSIRSDPIVQETTTSKEIALAIEPQAKILTKTKRKLVRESTGYPPVASNKEWKPPPPAPILVQSTKISVSNVPLIRLGNRKLIRASQLPSKPDIKVSAPKFPKIAPKTSVRTKYKIIKAPNKYKIDRRSTPYKIPTRLPNKVDRTVKHFILHSRSMLSPKRMIITDRKLLRMFVA